MWSANDRSKAPLELGIENRGIGGRTCRTTAAPFEVARVMKGSFVMDFEASSGPGSGRPPAAISPSGRCAAIVEFSDAGIISKTLDGVVVSWNPAAECIFGYSAAEIIGRPIAILAVPGQPDEMQGILQRIAAGERIAHYDTERRHKDGGIVEISLTVSPIRDDAGRLIGVSNIVSKLTGAGRASDELAKRQAHLRSILETVPDAMIVIDAGGLVQSFNSAAERLFGCDAKEVCGRNVKMLMPSPCDDNQDADLQRYRDAGERHIVIGRRQDGSTFPMELSVGEVRQGEHRWFTGFVRDLTETRHSERRLQDLQAELAQLSRLTEMGQTASDLAHELTQPLTAAANFLQAARRLLDGRDDLSFQRAMRALASAIGQVGRAGHIIRRLREFVKNVAPERQAEDILTVIAEASALALIGAKDRGIVMRFRPAPSLPRVFVDKTQIQQVLVNLVRNAVEAMETSARREITIETVRSENHFVRVHVADRGPGIAAEVAARLFQPFVTTKAQGMGIGLSLCRAIIEAHGGRLWAEANPGGGTIFRFTLPTAR
jgi:two-component system sensor kinase FixL